MCRRRRRPIDPTEDTRVLQYHAMVIILRSELFLGWSSDEESPRHSAFPQDLINVLSRTNPSNWSSSYISTPTHVAIKKKLKAELSLILLMEERLCQGTL